MTPLKWIRELNKEEILAFTLLLAILTIPLKNNWNSWAIVLFSITAVLQQPVSVSINRLKKDSYWKISAVFFFWMVCTWFWDNSGGFSIKQIETNASFLFLPLIMAIIPKLSPGKIATACYLFVASVITVCLICLIKSTLEYQQTHDYRVFAYHYLGMQMGLNAVYLSNYCIACIAWLLYFRFIYKGFQPFRVNTGITLAACVFLCAFMFLLSSKLSLALGMVFLVFIVLYISWLRKSLFKGLLVIVVAGIAAIALVKNLPYLQWRIAELKFKKWAGPQDDQNGLALRIMTWESAVELIREKPVLGYGLKGANEALVNKYIEKNFEMGIPDRYNSHNQFLETTLKCGLVGLALLLTLIIIPFRTALSNQKFLLTLMLVHFILVSLVEGTMEIQQELTFYWFFIFFFYYHYPTSAEQSGVNQYESSTAI